MQVIEGLTAKPNPTQALGTLDTVTKLAKFSIPYTLTILAAVYTGYTFCLATLDTLSDWLHWIHFLIGYTEYTF